MIVWLRSRRGRCHSQKGVFLQRVARARRNPVRLLELNRFALRTLWRSPLRTCLMMAGLAIGLAVLTAANSVGESTRQQTAKRVKNMLRSLDTVIIRPGASRT